MESRRSFLQKTALATTALGLFPAGQYAFNSMQELPVLRVGLIGVGLRGTNHLN
ncbi:MAG: twin-arginine translocation signal domain-containing protein, partial [Robiginitalea sp.]